MATVDALEHGTDKMTDIVERLRICAAYDPDQEEAANTIEALREENARLREEVERLKSEESCNDVLLEYAQAENQRLREENARLTKERDDFHMQYRAVCDEEVKIYVVEIERLRDELAAIREGGKE